MNRAELAAEADRLLAEDGWKPPAVKGYFTVPDLESFVGNNYSEVISWL